jgi:hypothetical protein
MAWLVGQVGVGGSGYSVSNGAAVPLSSFTAPAGSKMSLVSSGTSTAGVMIADTGFYLVTFGIEDTNFGASGYIGRFSLRNGLVTNPYQIVDYNAGGSTACPSNTNLMVAISTIVQIITKNSILRIQNDSAGGISITLNNTTRNASGICAFMTIVKLQ